MKIFQIIKDGFYEISSLALQIFEELLMPIIFIFVVIPFTVGGILLGVPALIIFPVFGIIFCVQKFGIVLCLLIFAFVILILSYIVGQKVKNESPEGV